MSKQTNWLAHAARIDRCRKRILTVGFRSRRCWDDIRHGTVLTVLVFVKVNGCGVVQWTELFTNKTHIGQNIVLHYLGRGDCTL